MSKIDSTARTAARKVMAAKKRADSWQIRCLKCGDTEPWNKRSARSKSVERSYVFGRCPKCKRIRIRVVEKVTATRF